MYRKLLATSLLLPLAAYGGEIYKCKGKNGEIVLTNMQCPDAKSTQHVGSYQAVRDDARSQVQAAQREPQYSEPASVASQSDEGYEASSPSGYRNGLSEHYRKKNDHHSPAVATQNETGGYANDLAGRYGNHDHAPVAEPTASDRSYREPAQNLTLAPPPPPPPPPVPSQLTDCRSSPGGAISCYDDKGHVSFGNVNPTTGDGRVYGEKGEVTDLHRQPANGALKSDNGTCVKNIYGQCQ